MSKVTIYKKNNYTVIENNFLNDKNLSWKAKGMLAYLLSLPNDWQIYLQEIEQHSKDGRESTANAIKELINSGYIKREKKKIKGKFNGYSYTVTEKPNTEKPNTEKPNTENPQLLSTNITNNLKELNTYIKKEKRNKKEKLSPSLKSIQNNINKITNEEENGIIEEWFNTYSEYAIKYKYVKPTKLDEPRKRIIKTLINKGFTICDFKKILEYYKNNDWFKENKYCTFEGFTRITKFQEKLEKAQDVNITVKTGFKNLNNDNHDGYNVNKMLENMSKEALAELEQI